MQIHYLKHDQIDKAKWDLCIKSAFNGIVYAYSWYLDIVSYKWEALVMGDYKAVMPLPAKRKYGIAYLYQPVFTQQLGVFATVKLNVDVVNKFITNIPPKFKVIDLNFNTYNKISQPKITIKERFTHELDLIAPYEVLVKQFNSNTKRNIKKAEKQNVQVMKQVNLKDFLLLVKQTSKEPLNFDHLNILRRIIPFAIKHKLGEVYGAYDKKNTLVSACFFIRTNQKAIYLLGASNSEGKELAGSFALVNTFIKENAEQNLTLDFEGSMIDGIARFYKGFGAKPVNYYRIKQNRLPLLIRFLK